MNLINFNKKIYLALAALLIVNGFIALAAEREKRESEPDLRADQAGLESARHKDTIPALLRFLLQCRTETYAEKAKADLESLSLGQSLCAKALEIDAVNDLVSSLTRTALEDGVRINAALGKNQKRLSECISLYPLGVEGRGVYVNVTRWLSRLMKEQGPLFIESFNMERISDRESELKLSLQAFIPVRDCPLCEIKNDSPVSVAELNKYFSPADLQRMVEIVTRETPRGTALIKFSLNQGQGRVVFRTADADGPKRFIRKLEDLQPYVIDPVLRDKPADIGPIYKSASTRQIDFIFRHDVLYRLRRIAVADLLTSEGGLMLKLVFSNYSPEERDIYRQWLLSEQHLELIDVKTNEISDYAVQMTFQFHRK